MTQIQIARNSYQNLQNNTHSKRRSSIRTPIRSLSSHKREYTSSFSHNPNKPISSPINNNNNNNMNNKEIITFSDASNILGVINAGDTPSGSSINNISNNSTPLQPFQPLQQTQSYDANISPNNNNYHTLSPQLVPISNQPQLFHKPKSLELGANDLNNPLTLPFQSRSQPPSPIPYTDDEDA